MEIVPLPGFFLVTPMDVTRYFYPTQLKHTSRQVRSVQAIRRSNVCSFSFKLNMSWEHIPVVDFQQGRFDETSNEFKAVTRDITAAFENVGFVYLRNHGIPSEKVGLM